MFLHRSKVDRLSGGSGGGEHGLLPSVMFRAAAWTGALVVYPASIVDRPLIVSVAFVVRRGVDVAWRQCCIHNAQRRIIIYTRWLKTRDALEL